ncbi:hypothetical protein MAPG_04686 [Magnaporthiopsis poae ATCC 64411]|uniref:Terpene synthase n=1 Tax=Magnaporthiopsis poae (strain ATCC 64411 / 73-15) TaxID=644358 RepID=A0A0C4DXE1_MAGP6|nr:hypothetical protein MAPG_04686 [Magnaporthiopsis poae ATCC 64411]
MGSQQTADVPADINVRLADELRGRTMVVPNMLSDLLQGWPSGRVNPHYERLKHVLEGILDCAVPQAWFRKKFIDSDLAFFTSAWNPDATWEDLYTMGLLTIWAFIWDDTFDMGELEVAGDWDRACVFRAQTLAYCRYWLGLESVNVSASEFPNWASHTTPLPSPSSRSSMSSPSPLSPSTVSARVVQARRKHCLGEALGYRALPPPAPNVACAIFKDLGERLCARFDEKWRRRVYCQIEYYINSTAEEQLLRIRETMPTYEHYLRVRHGTTGFRMFALIAEAATRTVLPSTLIDSPEMGVIMAEANFMIIMLDRQRALFLNSGKRYGSD